MKVVFIIVFSVFLLTGCSTATKTRQLGEDISNIQHPVALGLGILLYKVGKAGEKDIKDNKIEKVVDDRMKQ